MFTNASLARRIERAEVGLILEGARAAARRLPHEQLVIAELHGGAVVYIEPGAPFNKGVGFGFGRIPSGDELEEVERQFAQRVAPLQFEVSTLADPAMTRLLTSRRYELVGFENVLGLPIMPDLIDRLSTGAAGAIDVTRASEEEAASWLDTVATGFLHPDLFDGPPGHESISREVLERVFGDTIAAPGFERYLARRGAAIAGGASFRVEEGIAQLSGAATLPEHRRRGVQTALLRHRLLEAASRGCDLAVVTTQPGSKSQENVQKAGFALLYARAILVREPV